MQFLKGLVIFMGILIIAGLAVIVITIFNRSEIISKNQTNIKLQLPVGSIILDKSIDNNKIFFLIRLNNDTEMIKIFDLLSGEEVRNIDIIK